MPERRKESLKSLFKNITDVWKAYPKTRIVIMKHPEDS